VIAYCKVIFSALVHDLTSIAYMAWHGKGMGHAMTGSRYNTYISFGTQHGGMAASIRLKDYVQM
jgi:hypothetical protein